ncbi:rna exonuclease [Coemansia sp. RSA 1972]|nr:rna exonuclease [Coemansia sp. RSA 1972]
MASTAPLVWIDCEMTGLDSQNDTIIEIACVMTDGDLNVLEQGDDIVVHQPRETMDAMGDWCRQHHGQSGLTESVIASTVTMAEAEAAVLALVKRHCTLPRTAVLAGNSVHADRAFLSRLMPELTAFLHYRIIDVSSVKELARRWSPQVLGAAPAKKETHRALDDILESIAELRYYKQSLFYRGAAGALEAQQQSVSTHKAPLVWIDVETTGLVPEKDKILEIAMILTDGELTTIGAAENMVIGHRTDQLALNEWALASHRRSGLMSAVARSTTTLPQAEAALLARVQGVCPTPRRAVLAGNNVEFDRRFLERHMPALAAHLHFRSVDVSTVNELAKRWAPATLRRLRKQFTHRALNDVRESIRELQFYQSQFIRRDEL